MSEQDRKLDDLRAENARRFDEQDRRFQDFKAEQARRFDDFRAEQTRRFDEQDRRFDELFSLLREDKQKLQEVYETREHFQVRFSRAWGFATLVMGMLGGSIVYGVLRFFA